MKGDKGIDIIDKGTDCRLFPFLRIAHQRISDELLVKIINGATGSGSPILRKHSFSPEKNTKEIQIEYCFAVSD